MQQNDQEQQESALQAEEGEKQPEESTEVPATVVMDDIEEQLRVEQRKAEEYLDLLRRTQADFINYRRRTSQEQAETRTTARMDLVKQFLPILDDFRRALDTTPPELAHNSWVKGISLIARRFHALLDQLDIQQFGAIGEPFDPRLHEALTVDATSDAPEGSIIQVVQPGYMCGERIIRPAQVIVAGAPAPAGTATPE